MSEPAGLSGGFSRFRIDLAYDGTDFSGWAKQPELRTVQGEILRALEQIFGPSDEDFGIRVAGRTDAGVHADHQVCHIDLSAEQLTRLGRSEFSAKRLNGLLPEDVRILSVALAPEGFDARFSATGRSYRFMLADSNCQPDPKRSRYVLQVAGSLDEKAMNQAAKKLIGLKDFGAFCKPREGATTIRELRKLEIKRLPDSVIEVSLEADAFCHNMVRAIVGSLVAVGSGKLSVDEIATIQLEAKRVSKFKVVDAKGLSLSGISYPKDSELAKQAEKARNRRDSAEISV
jgi:tRNA pseudouridine38-40 synthase